MRDKGFDQLPVLAPAGGRLAGLVTLGNLLSFISRGRASPASTVSEVMFDFGRIDEVLTDPRRFGSDLKGKKRKQRKLMQITLDTPLAALSPFLEWNSAAVVTEGSRRVEASGRGDQGGSVDVDGEAEIVTGRPARSDWSNVMSCFAEHLGAVNLMLSETQHLRLVWTALLGPACGQRFCCLPLDFSFVLIHALSA
ncbi:hypothetical protein VTI74DRAFT_11329 [Chaetomium olivicolor]